MHIMKKILITITLFSALLLSIGCSANRGAAVLHTGQRQALGVRSADMAASAPMPMAVPESPFLSDISEAALLSNTERKLIRTAHVRIRAANLDAADDFITNLMRQFNAYASSTSVQENVRHYTLRVPAQYYDIFLAEMNSIGRLLSRFENTEDVTLHYFDLEGRLATKRELLITFQSYLGRANNIEEILAVEARIANLQFEIDRTGAQLRDLSNRIVYSTIHLTILGPAGLAGIPAVTLGERIAQLFGNFSAFLSTVVLILIGIVIYGIPSLALLTLLFWLLFGRVGLLRKVWQKVRGV